MSVCGCGFCGYAIRYHGEPEGTEPVEYIFCKASDWQKLEKVNMTCDRLEFEYDGIFFYAWKCKRCGTFTFFDDNWKLLGVYAPQENFTAETMQAPFEFGPFWNDFQWFDITESDIPAAEVFAKYPGNLWLAKNADEMRLYEDKACTKCVGQFRRFQVPDEITIKTMSLNAFKKMLANWDDIEFFYKGEYYNFMNESGEINIWRGQGYNHSVYSAAKIDVDKIINAKIFPDGKSIIEVQDEITF